MVPEKSLAPHTSHGLAKRSTIRTDSCRIALVSQGKPWPQPGVTAPSFVGSWRRVIDQALQLRTCLYRGFPSGDYVPLQCTFGSC